MPISFKITKTCAICGNTITYESSGSGYFRCYSRDLDFRPNGPERTSFMNQVHHCPSCAYSAYDLGRNDGESRASIALFYEWYKDVLELVSVSRTERSAEYFLQIYARKMRQKEYKEAADAAISAAWCCDSILENNTYVTSRRKTIEAASRCRDLAIGAINKTEVPSEGLLMMKADLLRRAGRFKEVLEEYKDFHTEDKVFKEVIAFQLKKAEDEDDSCYNIDQVR